MKIEGDNNKIKEILKNKNIIVISSIEWDWQWQRHHQITFWLSNLAEKVIFVENFPKRFPRINEISRISKRLKIFGRKSIRLRRYQSILNKAGNISIITPFLLPSTNEFFNKINLKFFLKRLNIYIVKKFGVENAIVWCYLPTKPVLDFIKIINPILLIYDCIDNYIGDPYAPKDIFYTEKELLKNSDIVICTSKYLYDMKRIYRKDIIEIPTGVDFNLFNKADSGFKKKHIKKICYYGDINIERINFNILKCIASAGYELWMIGPITSRLPKMIGNVKFFGFIDHGKIPDYIKKCDCLILPYNINEYTKGIIPAKFFECFATGKPIIATPIPNFFPYKDIIIINDTPEEFVYTIKNIQKFENEDKYNKRIEIAKKYSVDKQFDNILKTMRDKFKVKLIS